MKFTIATLLTALLSFVAGLYLPWWSVALAAFLVALVVKQKAFQAWLSGFLGVGLLWVLVAIIKNSGNDGVLAKKIADLFSLNGSVILLIVITGFVGALVGGLGALTGAFLQKR